MKKTLQKIAKQYVWKVMKISALVSIILCSLVNLSIANGSYAQEVLNTPLTLKLEHVRLSQALTAIEKQAKVKFVWSGYEVINAGTLSLQVHKEKLGDVLATLLKKYKLTYTVIERTIVINPLPEPVIQNENNKTAVPITPPPLLIKGTVTDEKGETLPGVSIQIKGSNMGTVTDESGRFSITVPDENAVLIFSFIGYKQQEVPVRTANRETMPVVLAIDIASLKEVVVVSTGYQDIPKERATGSFAKVDNELLNRRVSTNIIDRLEGVTSGLLFNGNFVQRTGNDSPYNVRGLSTIFANTKPLIIVDNFPYDGDINNINPNDVENVTILKDAAASSIWGARSGNGVIVITTKKGINNKPLTVNFNTNFNLTNKPDIFYGKNYLNTSDYIEAEKFLFTNGYYNANINSTTTRPVLSPVVEILAQQRNGAITEGAANAQIDAFRNIDLRNDISNYLYRSTGTQQYAINLNGGSSKSSYYVSAGYDQVPSVQVGDSYARTSLTSNMAFSPIDRLEAMAGISYILTNNTNNNPGQVKPTSKSSYYPYARLVDESGNPVALPLDYRYSYISSLANTQLLDWSFEPLNELKIADNTAKSLYAKFNASLKYTIIPGLSAELKYQLEKQNTGTRNSRSQQSYFTRNLINLNTQVNGMALTRPVPLGGILDQERDELTSNSLRGQLNFNRQFATNHDLSALAGIEAKELIVNQNDWRLYGYSDEIGTSVPVDYNTIFTKYSSLAGSGKVPYADRQDKLTDEYFSYFANAAYTYKDRYTISGSGRIDQSNLFGVRANQKSVPLWSAGAAWQLSKEGFYKFAAVPYLKVRATFGYNGNIDKTVSAYTTAAFSTNSSLTGAPYVRILNPPNPELQWERIGMFNIGLDFSTKNRMFSGSIEYFRKNGKDIIGYAPVDPTTGVDEYKGNVANIKGNGLDLELNFRNGNKLKWLSTLLFSRATDEVITYNKTAALSQYITAGDGNKSTLALTPVVGRPIFSVYSFRWAGLDPLNGDPQGYLNGQVSKNYASINTSKNMEDAVFHGSARPTIYGGFRNAVTFKNISLSVNLNYKLGYFIRRPSINYFNLASGWEGNGDYVYRWKQTGDEKTTSVPSFTYPIVTARETFYQYSEILVEKGDHIRFQDVQVSYEFPIRKKRLPFKALQVYGYANNLGVIWKATEADIDPDYVNSNFINPKTFALGLKTTF